MSDEIRVYEPKMKKMLSCTHIDTYWKGDKSGGKFCKPFSIQGTDEGSQKLFVKKVFNSTKNKYQMEVVFMGNHIAMEQYRYVKNPDEWITWGEMVFDEEQALELSKFISDAFHKRKGEKETKTLDSF
jgi:hypothetical protein